MLDDFINVFGGEGGGVDVLFILFSVLMVLKFFDVEVLSSA